MLTKRSVASVIILSIITFGIYGAWWTYVTLTALQQESRLTSPPPLLASLLVVFVSSAGGALVGYDADVNINEIKKARGIPMTDNKLPWIIVGIFVPAVTLGLIQHEINNLV